MLHWTTRTLLLALLIFPAVGNAEQAAPAAAKIRIGGSGGALATLQILGDAFRKVPPYATVVVIPSLGSGGGIKAVLAGAIDLAVISRPLKEAERGEGAVATDYARTPFVFATAAATKVSAITQRELLSIYSGDTKTWPDGRVLRLVLRPAGDSDTDLAKSLSPAMQRAVETAQAQAGLLIEITDQANAHSLQTIPGAFGTSTLAQIISEQRALQPLTLDGVVPSLQTLDDGSYRYFKTFSFVSAPKTTPLVQQFMAFVQSPVGKQILEKNGHSQVSGQ
ncbi:substrate-binding domain-containing protein [Polaromonas sp.]|uniref:PstS family phosphate ABC transporter substrate-binding protein n=1 Tax=Polaromonas sp. TaxID=1869339 RepID=UPI0018238979|nr:substrate-binding domain-containing protein [Polaromonas sp.]NMM08009.1 ABC transporter substrate-binding protein [Polaromonas sp.]